ncbi:MAG: hypothetical protein M5U33_02915 [Pseudorhodoplanes sp.]|nr:hypothetical protein [Pseudorhodoplanes sp.]
MRDPIEFSAPARRPRGPLPRTETPIVPADSIGGRALVAVVAIMTFLAAMTTGSVMMIRNAAVDWQSEVSREVTIQVRPGSGDVEADVQKAAEIARAFPGLSDARVYSREDPRACSSPGSAAACRWRICRCRA